MTYEPWKDDSILIRFEHILEKDEDAELSKPVRFNLADVYPSFEIELREVSLSGNQWIEDFQRLQFKTETTKNVYFQQFTNNSTSSSQYTFVEVEDLEIILNPMEIRSFIMSLSPKV
jgi:lysosomal alpha-mannosidase